MIGAVLDTIPYSHFRTLACTSVLILLSNIQLTLSLPLQWCAHMTWISDLATLGAATELSKQPTHSNGNLLGAIVYGSGSGLFPKAG
jgi:hypothetical protein